MSPSEKAKATRETLQLIRQEQLMSIRTARQALVRVMESEGASPAQILEAAHLLAEISK